MVELMEDVDFMETMTFEEYQEGAMSTAIYPDELIYPVLGLVGEAGEVAEKVKKFFRDNQFEVMCEDAVAEVPAETRMEIAKELSDVLWYLTAVAADIGYSLEEIAELNLTKLADRNQRGKLTGSGDNR